MSFLLFFKGSFLLKYLSSMIGTQSFMNFLKMYTAKYEGQLVTCKVRFVIFIVYCLDGFLSNECLF